MEKFRDIELYDDDCAGGFFNDKEIDISFEIDYGSFFIKTIKGDGTYVPYGNDSVLYDDGIEYELRKIKGRDIVCYLDYTISDGSKLSDEEEKELIEILNKLVFDFLKEDFESSGFDVLIYKKIMEDN